MERGFIKILIIFFVLISHFVVGEELYVTGTYQGKNIYVQNPMLNNEGVFCTKQVFVNGLLNLTNPTTTAYEIDLSSFKLNDKIEIRIEHWDGCSPKVINPQVIRPKDAFKFVDFKVNENSISWSTQQEHDNSRFFIEKRINEKWVIVQSSPGNGAAVSNNYNVSIVHNSGVNQYRIKCLDNNGDYSYSGILNYVSEMEPVTFFPSRVSNKITLSREALYEVLDGQGNCLVKGRDSEIHVENLSPGLYYLVIENQTEKFIKK